MAASGAGTLSYGLLTEFVSRACNNVGAGQDVLNAAYMNTSFMNSWFRLYRVRASIRVEIMSDSSAESSSSSRVGGIVR